MEEIYRPDIRRFVPHVRDVKAQLLDLQRLPQHPRELLNWRNWWRFFKRTTDYFGHSRGWFNDLVVHLNPYPRPFRRVTIESDDGTLLSGWLGLQGSPRPGVVVVPGMFSSKDDTAHKGRTIRMWRRWNYNVLSIDLRGFGQSGDSPNTPGLKESDDVLAAARYLHSFNNVTGVGVWAESLGASAAVIAAGRDAQSPRPVIDALLGSAPFADGRAASEHIGKMPHRRDPFYWVQRIFSFLLRRRSGGRFLDFVAYLEDSARHYGMSPAEMYALSNPRDHVPSIQAPALILHAEDDRTVPVFHAHVLADMAREKPNVAVWTLPWGEHCMFEVLDWRWYWRVAGRFFGRWLGT